MRALSLTQPWATLIARRAKRIETRSWATSYRGVVAIHAAKGFPRDCQSLCYERPFRDALGFGPGELPRGAIVAVGRIVGCYPTEGILLDSANKDHVAERAFGDYTPGRWAWLIEGVKPLATPIPCKGALGLWTVPESVETLIRLQGEERV